MLSSEVSWETTKKISATSRPSGRHVLTVRLTVRLRLLAGNPLRYRQIGAEAVLPGAAVPCCSTT
jgi:hypothetical protein